LAEAQLQGALAEGRGVEGDALPMRAVAVELEDDLPSLAARPQDEATEFAAEDERRLFRRGAGFLQLGEEAARVQRRALQIGAPAAFGTARDGTREVGLPKDEALQIDALERAVA